MKIIFTSIFLLLVILSNTIFSKSIEEIELFYSELFNDEEFMEDVINMQNIRFKDLNVGENIIKINNDFAIQMFKNKNLPK